MEVIAKLLLLVGISVACGIIKLMEWANMINNYPSDLSTEEEG